MIATSILSRSRVVLLLLSLVGLMIIARTLFSPVFDDATRLHNVALKGATSYFKGSNSDSAADNSDLPGEEPWTIPFSTSTVANRAIANGTLGFERIFVLGLPDRLAKRDGMELAASVTNLNLTWQDGVLGDKMHKGSIPPYHDDPKAGFFRTDGEVGCWRGHMNIVHKMVKEQISSALIMEDDADWDLHIVQQLQQFADVSREFLKEDPDLTWRRRRHARSGSPYGEGWDVLWVGHCGGWAAEDGYNHIAVLRNDTTVPPAMDINHQLYGVTNTTKGTCSAHLGNDPKGVTCDAPRLAPDERIIQERTKPLCTTGYAISLQGARKMLARLGGLSLMDVTAPVDWEMQEMCKQTGKKGADREASRCLTVSPPYIRTHRAKGPISADSDIEGHGGTEGIHEVGKSGGLVYPTRLNVENLIAGYEPESQYIKEADGKWRLKTATEYRSLP